MGGLIPFMNDLAASVNPTPEENSSQPDLITDDARRPRRGRLDPKWIPSWSAWLDWSPFRRLVNDFRLSDSAVRLWLWLYEVKDRYQRIEGDRAQAWFISKKFRWKPSTIHKNAAALNKYGYTDYEVLQGYQPQFTVKWGSKEIPENPTQCELPFLIPIQSGSASEGRAEPPESAPKGTPSLPQGNSKSAPKGTPYSTNCVPIVNTGVKEVQESENLSPPPGFPATEEEAIKDADARFPCSDRYIIMVWHAAMSRGGQDWTGRPITNWVSHVKRCWSFEKQDWLRHQQYIRRPKEWKKRRDQALKTHSTCPDTPGPKPGDPDFEDYIENL
jgi:hypothetical protein